MVGGILFRIVSDFEFRICTRFLNIQQVIATNDEGLSTNDVSAAFRILNSAYLITRHQGYIPNQILRFTQDDKYRWEQLTQLTN